MALAVGCPGPQLPVAFAGAGAPRGALLTASTTTTTTLAVRRGVRVRPPGEADGGSDRQACGRCDGRHRQQMGNWGRCVCHAASDEVRQDKGALLADEPTWFERLCAALMYVMPLSEGLYRLALVSVRYTKSQALEFLLNCKVQLNRHNALALSGRIPTEYTKEDIVALQAMMQMSQRFYNWLSHWADQLFNLSVPVKITQTTSKLSYWTSTFFSTPDALWHISCLLYMSIIAGVAGLKLGRSEQRKDCGRWFCKPELLSVSYFCAILLRVSWVPLEGMSDLSFQMYRLGATLLTLITTVGAASQMQKLLCGQLSKFREVLESMVEQAKGIAHLHRNFLLLDWLLCLFSHVPLGTKCLRSLLLLVYWMAVNALETEAETARQLPST